MDSFIHVAGWSQHLPSHTRRFGHVRSLSSIPTTTTSVSSTSTTTAPSSPSYKPKPPPKSPSTSSIPIISLSPKTTFFPNNEMSTLPDPRTRALSPPTDTSSVTPSPTAGSPNQHPDLSDEVATLSTKLINAINHQTVLDDTLSATRHELETARERIRELETQVASQRDMMSGDVWLRRSTLENERKNMQAEKRLVQLKLADETTKRQETEKEKRKIEQELENLTTALFEEANKMVIGAKEEAKQQHETLSRKNDQLKAQLADSESLLKSQQEQLSELKQVLETMVTERDDQTSNTAPSSPGAARFESKDDDRRSLPGGTSPAAAFPYAEGQAPAPPTSFTHLVQPVLRNDLAAYDDFLLLARLSRTRAGSRVSSGSIGGIIGLGGSTSSAHPSNSSNTSLTTSAAQGSAPQSPNTPVSATSTSSNTPSTIPHLKDTRFFKRILTEDVEPTLRLDTAPGLSWLARRTVLSSLADGSLVVEPVPATLSFIPSTKPQHYPCAMCGESRKDEAYLRNHRFRTNETESAQRYPLCSYCLARIRSTGQFVGFLRMVKDGHWCTDGEDHEKAAWEESVRLREQMFWARIGGGVVPIVPADTHEHEHEHEHQHGHVATFHHASSALKNASGLAPAPSEDDDASNYELERMVSVEEPHTPQDQTDGTRPLRYSVQSLSLDTLSVSGSESAKRLSTATDI